MDKQERRNYGEPVHEDHDLLGMFTPYEYTWITPGKGLLQIGLVVAAFLSVIGLVKLNMPEYPVYPREFEGGLERELGGPGAVRVSNGHFSHHAYLPWDSLTLTLSSLGKSPRRPVRAGIAGAWVNGGLSVHTACSYECYRADTISAPHRSRAALGPLDLVALYGPCRCRAACHQACRRRVVETRC